MNHYRATRFVLATILTLLLSPNAWTKPVDFLGSTLQLGPIPLSAPNSAPNWSMAVPLGVAARQCQLETADEQLFLTTFANNEAWLVVQARHSGSISGFLRVTEDDGTLHNIAIAAEGVRVAPGTYPTLLLVNSHGGASLRRMLRLPVAAESAEFGGVIQPMASPDTEGWQLLEVAPPQGKTEKQGKLLITDGSEIRLQVSLRQSVTTLASTLLPVGWSYEQVMATTEQLAGTELRARLGVVGLRQNARMLRMYDLKRDPRSGQFAFFGRTATPLPALNPTLPHQLLQLRAYDRSARMPVRRRFMLRLAGERALLIDPRLGAVRERVLPGLRFSGAAAKSRMKRDRLFAVRREARTGVRYLRRWWVNMASGQPQLRGQLYRTPLRERMGMSGIRAFDLRTWRRDGQTVDVRARESLLFLASTIPLGGARRSLEVFELQPLPDGSGRLAFARRRFTSGFVPPAGGERPAMQWLKTPTVGSAGYPRRLQISLPNLRAGEIIELAGIGGRFTGRARVQGVTHAIRTSGYSMAPAIFMHSEFDSNATSIRRRILTPNGLITRARGQIGGSRILELRTSARGRHSFALSDDGVGGIQARYSLRMLSNGLPAGTNLPPQVDAGPDLTTTSTGGTGTSVRLRAQMSDANGDSLAVHWSAPGVRFSHPNARMTRAIFPDGKTQVRIRARENSGNAVSYEGSDILDVTVLASSAADDTPALVTALRGIYPNPANPRTNIAFTVGHRDRIWIQIYDLAGHLVRDLLNEERNAGAYDVPWDGVDDQGQSVASGVYPVRLTSSEGVDTQRAVIIR